MQLQHQHDIGSMMACAEAPLNAERRKAVSAEHEAQILVNKQREEAFRFRELLDMQFREHVGATQVVIRDQVVRRFEEASQSGGLLDMHFREDM
eukprot:15461215-Alexandrium_andersonii.AAC.1